MVNEAISLLRDALRDLNNARRHLPDHLLFAPSEIEAAIETIIKAIGVIDDMKVRGTDANIHLS